jgi:hypothetical protein
VILSRHVGPLDPEVERGIRTQREIRLVVHRVAGPADVEDRSRWAAIARARNEGKLLGSSPWLMFLDDDVVLGQGCIASLLGELGRRPAFAALAADYLGERYAGRIAHHVSMGATLFRRAALRPIYFRWDDTRCECQCCCDDLRRQLWGIDYSHTAIARHLPKSNPEEHTTASRDVCDDSAITCMCVTHNRVHFLRRSIQCFLNQTYPDRELVIVYQSDDEATRQFLAELHEPQIRPLEVPALPRLLLGSLRNIARQAGTGKYVATWDDDDWCGPTRLAEQMRAIRDTGKRGCVLARLTMYDYLTNRAYISDVRPWEQSILVERAVLPPYPDVAKSEDTPGVDELVRQGQLCFLDQSELYIYTRHGKNTCDRRYWEYNLSRSRPLGQYTSAELRALLGIHGGTFEQLQNLRGPLVCDSGGVRHALLR